MKWKPDPEIGIGGITGEVEAVNEVEDATAAGAEVEGYPRPDDRMADEIDSYVEKLQRIRSNAMIELHEVSARRDELSATIDRIDQMLEPKSVIPQQPKRKAPSGPMDQSAQAIPHHKSRG